MRRAVRAFGAFADAARNLDADLSLRVISTSAIPDSCRVDGR